MSPARKEKAAKKDKPKTAKSASKAAETIVLSDPIGFVVERIVALGPGVKVKIQDEQWADVSFESGSLQEIIRGLREIATGTKESLTSKKPEKRGQQPQAAAKESFVDKLSADGTAAVSFCIAGESRLYVDAVPMPLKAYLVNFVQELCGVQAIKATMTTGICAKIRSSDTYAPNA